MQKIAQHTPGPWPMEWNGDGKRITIGKGLVEGPNGYEVAEVYSDDCPREVAEANGRLVSASPDLKEIAARWALVMFHSGVSAVENSDDPLEALLFDTYAALFKATGRDVVADTLETLTAGNRALSADEAGR